MKGKLKNSHMPNPSTYVMARINENEILRTSISETTCKPKWNQNYLVTCKTTDVITFSICSVDGNRNSTSLGCATLNASSVDNIIKRFHFGLMSRKTLDLVPSENYIQSDINFKIIVGFSKSSRPVSISFFFIFINQTHQINSLSHVSTPDEHNDNDINSSGPNLSLLNVEDHEQVEENVDELPIGWEKRQTTDGRDFYVDHNRQTTQWSRPQPLPVNWETRHILSSNRIFYLETRTGTTSWVRPTSQNVLSSPEYIDSLQHSLPWNGENNENSSRLNSIKKKIPETEIVEEKQLKSVIDDLLGPLPDNVEIKIDKVSKRKFFVDHNSKKTFWEDPRLSWLYSDSNPLPKNWSIRVNDFGIPYFIDHKNKATTFCDPRNGMIIFPSAVIAMKFKNSFRDKMLYFRNLCQELKNSGVCTISICRDRLISDSFAAITNYDLQNLHRRITIKFNNEEGLDFGGLSREWLYNVSHEILNPNYCLFMSLGSSSNYVFEINPLSNTVQNYKNYFIFVGRLIGISIFHSKYLDCFFSTAFYKNILNLPCILEDIMQIDKDFYNSINWISKNNIEEANLDLYFCVDNESFDQLQTFDLKPNGSSIKVTEKNKDEYIKLLVDWKLNYGKQEQMQCVISGVADMVPLTWLSSFTVKEFEMLLCGVKIYDIDDWKNNTKYKGYDKNCKTIIWFWEFIEKIDQHTREQFLLFVTGTSRIPQTGFRDLFGSDGSHKFTIEKWGNANNLPRAHTCFNRIELPPYASYKDLSSKVLKAL
ncbi:hypothetical protein HZS_1493, partial [Henneguya salminicola]